MLKDWNGLEEVMEVTEGIGMGGRDWKKFPHARASGARRTLINDSTRKKTENAEDKRQLEDTVFSMQAGDDQTQALQNALKASSDALHERDAVGSCGGMLYTRLQRGQDLWEI